VTCIACPVTYEASFEAKNLRVSVFMPSRQVRLKETGMTGLAGEDVDSHYHTRQIIWRRISPHRVDLGALLISTAYASVRGKAPKTLTMA
jgi:hypothetical protein